MPTEAFPWEAVTAIGALSGIFVGAFLTHKLHRDRDQLELKRDVLRRFMGYRWQLTPGGKPGDGLVYTALNEIPVVFAGDDDVEGAFDAFYNEVVEERSLTKTLAPLARAMAKSARVPHRRWSQVLIERPLTPSAEPSEGSQP